MIKLIASDMDGTLLDEDNKLPSDFFEILDELKDIGTKFIVASGRPYYTLYDNFSPKSDEITYIADNGSCIIMNGELIYKKTLQMSDVEEIVKECKAIDCTYVVICGIKGAYVFDRALATSDEAKEYYSRITFINSVSEIDDDVYKIGLYDIKGAFKNSYNRLYPLFKDKFDVVVSGKTWIDIMIKGVNKGKALQYIQEKLSISPQETMAFGDYYNDIELLSRAEYSFVMENANADLKKYGNYLASSNKENGVIKAVKQFALAK